MYFMTAPNDFFQDFLVFDFSFLGIPKLPAINFNSNNNID